MQLSGAASNYTFKNNTKWTRTDETHTEVLKNTIKYTSKSNNNNTASQSYIKRALSISIYLQNNEACRQQHHSLMKTQ